MDDLKRIPLGSIEQAGANMLAVVRALAMGEGPTEATKSSVGVYFDVFGLFAITYPAWLGATASFTSLTLAIALTVKSVTDVVKKTDRRMYGVILDVLACFISQIVTFVISIIVVNGLSVLVMVADRSMSWYSTPLLMVPLYILPTIAINLYAAVLKCRYFERTRSASQVISLS